MFRSDLDCLGFTKLTQCLPGYDARKQLIRSLLLERQQQLQDDSRWGPGGSWALLSCSSPDPSLPDQQKDVSSDTSFPQTWQELGAPPAVWRGQNYAGTVWDQTHLKSHLLLCLRIKCF